MATEIVRELVDGEWVTKVGTGGGATPNLAAVLAEGAAAGGTGITGLGATTIVVPELGTGLTITIPEDNNTTDVLLLLVGTDGANDFEVERVSGTGATVKNLVSSATFVINASSDAGGADRFTVLSVSEEDVTVTLSSDFDTVFEIDYGAARSLRAGFNSLSEIIVGSAAGELGFYGTTGIPKQTGVAVTAGGIHAALVALGLIAA